MEMIYMQHLTQDILDKIPKEYTLHKNEKQGTMYVGEGVDVIIIATLSLLGMERGDNPYAPEMYGGINGLIHLLEDDEEIGEFTNRVNHILSEMFPGVSLRFDANIRQEEDIYVDITLTVTTSVTAVVRMVDIIMGTEDSGLDLSMMKIDVQ